MRRDDELAAIARWITERGVKRERPAYAAPVQAALPPAQEAARLAAVRVELPNPRAAMRVLWATLQSQRRAAKG
jgi:hypothetical protein